MNNKNIAAIILASGKSSRMRRTNKLLLELNGMKICEYSMKQLKELHIDTVVVTCYDDVKNLACKYGAVVVENKESYLGQSRSLVLGVNEAIDYDAVLFVAADQPLITKETFKKLINRFLIKHKIVACQYGQTLGTPAIFPRKYYKDILNLTGDIGGKKIISDNIFEVEKIDIHHDLEGFDVDSPSDYEKLCEMYENSKKIQ